MEDSADNHGPTPGDPNKPLQQLEQEIKPRVKDKDVPPSSDYRFDSTPETPIEPVELPDRGPAPTFYHKLPGAGWTPYDATE